MTINFDNIINSTEHIFKVLSDLDIYEKYLSQQIQLNKLYTCINPNHQDNNPSMGFYESKYNIKFKCFGCGESGNSIEFVKLYHQCEFKEAINFLKDDFDLNKPIIRPKRSNILSTKKYTDIIPTYRNFKLIDFDYWTNRYSIPLIQLLKFNVKATKQVNYINKANEYKLWAEGSNSNPIYTYIVNSKFKCYRPLSPKGSKWLSNAGLFDIQGLEQLTSKGELLIITSSLKDVMLLDLLGYNAIALGGEGNYIPDSILDYLYSCFDNIVIFYDNDKPGLDYGEKLAKKIQCSYTYIPLEYESTKDISDFCEKLKLNETKRLLKQLF